MGGLHTAEGVGYVTLKRYKRMIAGAVGDLSISFYLHRAGFFYIIPFIVLFCCVAVA